MKTTLLLFFSLVMSVGQLFANAELIDLNQEWLNQTDINVHEIKNVPADEVGKIKMHLRLVEQTLRARSTSHLSKTQLLNRSKCLDILHAYWQAGVFPQNESYAFRTPLFIDKYNTFCAVGHLMKETDAENIARAISAADNLIYVRDIKNKQAIAWMNQSGLTLEECAWIQPGYVSPSEYELDLSGLSPTNPIVNRVIVGTTSPVNTFSATLTSSAGLANPVTDASGNVLFQLGNGSMQCINLTFQGSPLYLMQMQGSMSALGGTLEAGDSITFGDLYNSSFDPTFDLTYLAPGTAMTPNADMTMDSNWVSAFYSNTPTTFTICATRSSSSSSLNNDLPVNLSVLINASVPVVYNSFTLEKANEEIHLNWSTAAEAHNNYFTIEKSIDGKEWEAIGSVTGRGIVSSETQYSFIDENPIIGKNWYRIKNTDIDGSETYSDVNSIVYTVNEFDIKVLSQNPVQHTIDLKVLKSTDIVGMDIINVTGQQMNFERFNNGMDIQLDVSSLPPGIYFLRSPELTYKFMKQ